MTCWMPAAAIRDSRWVRNGKPGGRQHGLGRRQRQRTQAGALSADEDDGVDLRRVHRTPLVPLPSFRSASAESCATTSPRATARARSASPTAAAPATSPNADRPGKCRCWCDGPPGCGPGPGRWRGPCRAGSPPTARRRFATRPAEPVTQVDVLHVHEVALVEPVDLVERRPAQQQARARQPADGALAGLESLLAVGRRPRVGLPQRADDGVHAAADEARLMPRRRIDRAVGVADQRAERAGLRPSLGSLQQCVDAARPPLHVGVGDDEELGARHRRGTRRRARLTAVP